MRVLQTNSGLFESDAKLLDLTEKLKKASGKYRINMVTWS